MGLFFTDDWWDDAQCAGRDPGQFERPTKKAYEICAGCPVRDMCLEHAIDSPWVPYGMWAGVPQKKLQRLWRARHPRWGLRAEVEALIGRTA